MQELKFWNWKYKVYFHQDIYEQVVAFSYLLTRREKEIYHAMLAFYRSFYSFGMLLEELSESVRDATGIIEFAVKRKADLIYTPIELLPRFMLRIRSLPISQQCKCQLEDLLRYSTGGKNVDQQYQDLNRLVFGQWYQDVKVENKVYTVDHGRPIHGDAEKAFRQIYKGLLSDPVIRERFGPCAAKNFFD